MVASQIPTRILIDRLRRCDMPEAFRRAAIDAQVQGWMTRTLTFSPSELYDDSDDAALHLANAATLGLDLQDPKPDYPGVDPVVSPEWVQHIARVVLNYSAVHWRDQ